MREMLLLIPIGISLYELVPEKGCIVVDGTARIVAGLVHLTERKCVEPSLGEWSSLAGSVHYEERTPNSKRRRMNMKKLLSLLFASMVVFSLTMPAVASTATTDTTTKTAKTTKAKTTKSHKSRKAANKVPVKTSNPAPAKTN
jgi:hypothetical protein